MLPPLAAQQDKRPSRERETEADTEHGAQSAEIQGSLRVRVVCVCVLLASMAARTG